MNKCKLTECQGKPRCPQCLAMDARYGRLPADPAKAEELAKKAVSEYLTACRMTDRELLEMAAKAAGQERSVAGDLWSNARGMLWNPIADDGDALRLAVKLNLHVEVDAEYAGCVTVSWGFYDRAMGGERSVEQNAPEDGDDYAATRRAIVRAAAEVGRSMP